MKKRTTKIILTGITIVSIFLLVSCDKKESTEPEEIDPKKNPPELVGTWYSQAINMDLFITTNSAQKAVDINSQGNGSIVITGGQQVELKYLFSGLEDDGKILMVWATNIPRFELGLGIYEGNYPVCFMAFHMAPDPLIKHEVMALFRVMLSETESIDYFGNTTNLSYDPATFTLTANNAQLLTENSTDTVNVNGTLTNAMIDVPANTPTNVLSTEIPFGLKTTVIFSADGKFTRTSVFEWGTENASGTWEVSDGNNLMIVETYKNEEDQTVTETISGIYTISSSGILTVDAEMSTCDLFDYFESGESYSEQDCLTEYEKQNFMEKGSLVAATVQVVFTYSKSETNFKMKSPLVFNGFENPAFIR